MSSSKHRRTRAVGVSSTTSDDALRQAQRDAARPFDKLRVTRIRVIGRGSRRKSGFEAGPTAEEIVAQAERAFVMLSLSKHPPSC
jgi:hypothetical protein